MSRPGEAARPVIATRNGCAIARQYQGSLVLRIEDTDLERSNTASVQAILDGLDWLGLDYDAGPFFQTHRFDRYHEVINNLMANGLAYRCDCTKERLAELRTQQMAAKLKPRYDGYCRSRIVNPVTPHVVRFRNPDIGSVTLEDLIRGPITFDNAELDDLVIRRSDGSPTYNLAVVVDDLDMEITHVIRGDDHINNTPRQINIIRALGRVAPRYGHVPMILGADGTRLSKRHGATSVMEYQREGFLPEALLNYLARLGWAYGDQEIFSRKELVELFDINRVQRAPARFDPKKLRWLNQQYLMQADPGRLAKLLVQHLENLGIVETDSPDPIEVIKAQQGRAQTVVELATNSVFFYRDPGAYEVKDARKFLTTQACMPLSKMSEVLSDIDDWCPQAIHAALTQVADQLQVKLGAIAQPLRVAITGRAASPGLDIVLFLVGKSNCLRRIKRAIAFVGSIS